MSNEKITKVKSNEWESSYARSENYVFYPSDEMVRFFSKYLRKRIGIDKFIDLHPGLEDARILDVCCGIGRNLIFGSEMGFKMYGSDLSKNAIEVAKMWLEKRVGPLQENDRLINSDIRNLPWDDKYFSHVICDSALDSMSFEVAQEGVSEIARLIVPGGYFYCNLISGDETNREPNYEGEEIVSTVHEKGTIQSYFNQAKIFRLLESEFEIISCKLHKIIDPISKTWSGRWHIVTRRR